MAREEQQPRCVFTRPWWSLCVPHITCLLGPATCPCGKPVKCEGQMPNSFAWREDKLWGYLIQLFFNVLKNLGKIYITKLNLTISNVQLRCIKHSHIVVWLPPLSSGLFHHPNQKLVPTEVLPPTSPSSRQALVYFFLFFFNLLHLRAFFHYF